MTYTESNYVTWRCDHCGRTCKGTANRPKGWRNLAIRIVIEDSTMASRTTGRPHPAPCFVGDACERCAKALRAAAMRMKKAWRP